MDVFQKLQTITYAKDRVMNGPATIHKMLGHRFMARVDKERGNANLGFVTKTICAFDMKKKKSHNQ